MDDSTRVVRSETVPLAVRSMAVVLVDGEPRGTRAELPAQGSLTIGSSPGTGLRVDDRTVSRIHCELTLQADGARIRDLGSTNGTLVDGVRVRDADIFPGATIRVGSSTLRLLAGTDPVTVPVSSRTHLSGLVGSSFSGFQPVGSPLLSGR